MGDVRPGDWTCPGCQANVFASKSQCYRCGEGKPGGGGGGGGGGYGGGYGGGGDRPPPNVRPGDWTCPSCTAAASIRRPARQRPIAAHLALQPGHLALLPGRALAVAQP